MSTENLGRFVRPQKKGVPTALATAIVLGAGMAIPMLTAGGASAATVDTWDKIAQCESSGQWNLPYGDADSTGGLQFQRASWSDALAYLRSKGVDTSGYPSMPYQATKQQQIIAGEALLALQGPGAWACNPMVGSPLKSKNDSMFLGGPNPYPSSSTPSTPSTPPKTPTKPSTPSAPAAGDKYTVVSGDTLAKIAVAKKVSGGWQALYTANKSVIGSNPNLIYPGQKLTIPQPEVKYTVKSGDNLTKIATTLGVKGGWKAIYDKNKDVIGDNPNMIKPGMVLVVSGGTGSSTPSAPSTPSTPAKPSTPDNSTPSTNGWVAPLAKGTYTKGDNVTQNGACISRTCGGHSGLDMSAKSGTPVKAIASGTVVFAGYGYADPSGAYGLEVILKLPDGKYALYGHLSAKTVSTGDKVSAGQMIGNVGSSGNASGPHLHFEIRTDPKAFAVGIFLNPVTYMAGKGVSL